MNDAGGSPTPQCSMRYCNRSVLLRPEAPQVAALIEQRKPDRPMSAGEDHPGEGSHVAQRTGFHDGVDRQMPSPDGATIDASHRKDISHRQPGRGHQAMDRAKEGTHRAGRQLILPARVPEPLIKCRSSAGTPAA